MELIGNPGILKVEALELVLVEKPDQIVQDQRSLTQQLAVSERACRSGLAGLVGDADCIP